MGNINIRIPENAPYCVEIDVFSTMNDFIDYTFTVNAAREEEAVAALQRAYDDWWETADDTGLTMFEQLEHALTVAGIPFESKVNEEEE